MRVEIGRGIVRSVLLYALVSYVHVFCCGFELRAVEGLWALPDLSLVVEASQYACEGVGELAVRAVLVGVHKSGVMDRDHAIGLYKVEIFRLQDEGEFVKDLVVARSDDPCALWDITTQYLNKTCELDCVCSANQYLPTLFFTTTVCATCKSNRLFRLETSHWLVSPDLLPCSSIQVLLVLFCIRLRRCGASYDDICARHDYPR